MELIKKLPDFRQTEAIIKDSIIKLKLDPKNLNDLKILKLLQAREENIDFEMELAEMICGDNNCFPYRSSFYLTKFFKDLALNYEHDGSTRRFWVRDVLLELDISQIGFVIENGLLKRKDFIDFAKKNILVFDEFQNNAIKEFKRFIDESLKANDTIDLSTVLDLNVNIELLFDNKANTKDIELNLLIQEAKERFLNPNDKQIAIEKLWDAFERIKTYFDTNKKKSSEELINIIKGEFEDSFFQEEFSKLTSIGNNYRIRHHEKDKKEIVENKNLNYLFFRMLSLIDLCLINIQDINE